MAKTVVRWHGARVRRQVEGMLDRNLDRAAEFLKSQIQKSMKKGGGRGDVGRRRVRRSRPGEPPFIQTGRLRQSIFARGSGKHSREVGTNLLYGTVLEIGGRRVAARPFIRSALNSNRKVIARIIATGKR